MYKVILVDDEPLVSESMKRVIEWEKMGFYICATADSGEKACVQLQEYKPDLVITDVMMPQMNGIELAEYINKNFAGTEVIIVSGYDEFDFARSAMKAGVMEYILKPTKKEELEKSLERVYQRIQRKKDIDKNMKELKMEAEKSVPVLKNQLFNELSSRMIPQEQNLAQTLKYYKSPLKGKTYQLWCFDLDKEIYEDNPEMRELLWVQLQIIIREKIEGKFIYDFFVRGKFIFYIVENVENSLEFETVEEFLDEILSEFQNLTKLSLSVGISREYGDYHNMHLARKDCETALEERCNLGGGNCIFYEEVSTFTKSRLEYDHELLDQIYIKMHALNKEEVFFLIDKLYAELKDNRAIYQHFYSQSVLILTELYTISEKDEDQKNILDLIAELNQYKTWETLKNVIKDTIEKVLDKAKEENSGKNQEIVEHIKNYVSIHLAENITLSDVAEEVHLSKSYLCSIFKKVQGETFFSYLTKTRIEKAKILLRKSEHKVYRIAEMVGYMDYTYFSQVFKKYTGVTAGEYREIYDGE